MEFEPSARTINSQKAISDDDFLHLSPSGSASSSAISDRSEEFPNTADGALNTVDSLSYNPLVELEVSRNEESSTRGRPVQSIRDRNRRRLRKDRNRLLGELVADYIVAQNPNT